MVDFFIERLEKYYSKDYNDYIGKKLISKEKDNYNDIYSEYRKTIVFYMVFKRYHIGRKLRKAKMLITNLPEYASINNKQYLENKANKTEESIKKIGNNVIDQHQLNSILVDEDNVLVIAGAGTGKTTTIIAKIKYLLLVKNINPEDILVLTYTNAATDEMKNRIKQETNIELDIFTFHKLGRNIIKEVEGKPPTLINFEIKDFVNKTLKELVDSDDVYLQELVDYLYFNQYLLKTRFDFDSKYDYNNYVKLNPLVTLDNINVKSTEEVMIANFLLKNGIVYKYEEKYSIDTSNSEYGQYRPDFYLPNYNIWIEHFAIDENNNVPPFFEGKNGKTAKQIYNDSIKWKREIHSKNNTVLIETYSYEHKNGKLLENLEKKLKAKGVKFAEINYVELLNKFEEKNRSTMSGLVELFGTVINLVKINNYTYDFFVSIEMERKANKLRKLILPILNKYITILNDSNEIDYNDMLNKASEYIYEGKYSSKYKYVIVDECQDMSKTTYNILKALRNSADYKLFCVGDDWQSIYRFAGSNVSYITNFEDYFGISEVFIIPQTYRFSQSIADISGRFVMKNNNQIQKNIYSIKDDYSFCLEMIEGYTEKNCITFMEEELRDLPKGSKVLFLGRYNYDIRMLNGNFTWSFDHQEQAIRVNYIERLDLNIYYRTVHSSKGLESDYIFILNNKNGSYGFPSMIQDNDIIDYLLDKPDHYPYSEERRLFYVALTRTKKKVWLLVNINNESIFVNELKKEYERQLKQEKYTCPTCGGKLIKRESKHGPFFGCSNYPNCKYIKNINNGSKNYQKM